MFNTGLCDLIFNSVQHCVKFLMNQKNTFDEGFMINISQTLKNFDWNSNIRVNSMFGSTDINQDEKKDVSNIIVYNHCVCIYN